MYFVVLIFKIMAPQINLAMQDFIELIFIRKWIILEPFLLSWSNYYLRIIFLKLTPLNLVIVVCRTYQTNHLAIFSPYTMFAIVYL